MKEQRHFLLSFAGFVFLTSAIFFVGHKSNAASLPERLAGSILLQVESKGEAWYVDPLKKDRWYLGRPHDAFAVMRRHGLGITDTNLSRIPRSGSTEKGDTRFTERFLGRILLQVESKGEAWYVDPREKRRYSLGRPEEAFTVMRTRGIGITNGNLEMIVIAGGSALPTKATTPVQQTPALIPASFHEGVRGAVNTNRVRAGLSSLVLHDAMNMAAQQFANDMIARNYFALKTPEGLGADELLENAGYEPRVVGTLVASGLPDAPSVVDFWAGDEGSRQLLLRSDGEEMGVGMSEDGRGETIWVLFIASSQVRYEQTITLALSDMEAMRQAMLVRVNHERAKEGLLPLALNATLNLSAQKKSEDMFTRNYFAHESPDGVKPHDLITSTGYPARASAENLAKGPESVGDVMTGWMNSPGHRANILFKDVDEAGFGLKLGRNASGFNIYWTQHFGKR